MSSWVVHNTIEYNSLVDLLHIAQHPVQFNLFCAVRNANPCFTEHTVWVLPPVVCHIAVLCSGEWQMLVAVNSSAGDTLLVHSGGTKGE